MVLNGSMSGHSHKRQWFDVQSADQELYGYVQAVSKTMVNRLYSIYLETSVLLPHTHILYIAVYVPWRITLLVNRFQETTLLPIENSHLSLILVIAVHHCCISFDLNESDHQVSCLDSALQKQMSIIMDCDLSQQCESYVPGYIKVWYRLSMTLTSFTLIKGQQVIIGSEKGHEVIIGSASAPHNLGLYN